MENIREGLENFAKNELNVYELRSSSASRERILKTTALGLLAFLAVGLLIVSNSYSFVMVRRHVSKLEAIETRIRSIIENIIDGMITEDEAGPSCSVTPAAETTL